MGWRELPFDGSSYSTWNRVFCNFVAGFLFVAHFKNSRRSCETIAESGSRNRISIPVVGEIRVRFTLPRLDYCRIRFIQRTPAVV